MNELAAVESGGGFSSPASPRYRQYQQAVRDQKAQIAKTERAARRSGCSGGFAIFRANAALCDRIRSSLGQMRANLDQLQGELQRLAPRGGRNGRQRAAIVEEMRRNGCQMRQNERETATREEAPRRRSLVEQIFGVRTYREDGSRAGTEYIPDERAARRYGTFRTLCVRTCDGYYFPISFSTVPERFPEDEAACQAMCPGQEVQLYVHAMPSQDSEDMISYRTDEPYTALPAAFTYRKELKEGCACNRSASINFTEIAGSGGIREAVPQPAAEQANAVPLPVFKGDPGLDPETAANSGGRFTAADVAALARRGEPATASTDGAPRRIRVVGPSFFPVQ